MQEQRSLCLCLSNTSAEGEANYNKVQSACHIIAKWEQIAHFTFDSCIPICSIPGRHLERFYRD